MAMQPGGYVPLFRFLLFVFLCSVQTAFAGAWLQPKGDGLFILQETAYTTDRYFDGTGKLKSQPRFSKWEHQPYLEYGLSNFLTMGGTFYAQADFQSGHEKLGVADPSMFLRSVLWKDDRQVLSLQPLLKYKSQYRNKTTPRGGSSTNDAELSLLYGRNLHLISPRDYLDARIGYRVRGDELHNQWLADLAYGFNITDRWQIIPAIRATKATHKNDAAFVENGDMDYDLLKLELGVAYHLNDRRWWSLTLFDHTMGQQTGNGYGASLGYALKF